jgi:hypothetical protein
MLRRLGLGLLVIRRKVSGRNVLPAKTPYTRRCGRASSERESCFSELIIGGEREEPRGALLLTKRFFPSQETFPLYQERFIYIIMVVLVVFMYFLRVFFVQLQKIKMFCNSKAA